MAKKQLSIHRLRTFVGSTFAFAISSTVRSASSFSLASVRGDYTNHNSLRRLHPSILSSTNPALPSGPSFILSQRGGSSISSSSSITYHHRSLTTMSSATASEPATITSTSMSSGDILTALRNEMEEAGVDALIVPSDDPHLSEYVADAYGRRAFVTSFDGSAGTALVTKDEAFLWTDSRYWNQANLQLDSNHWKLMKAGETETPTIPKFLADHAKKKYEESSTTYRLGMDPYVHAASFAKEVNDAFATATKEVGASANTAKNVDDDSSSVEDSNSPIGVLHTLDSRGNLVDRVWGDARPPVPKSPFRVHPLKYAGMSVADKLDKIRSEMKEKGATLSVFPTLDELAYLFNLRAIGDVFSCPVGIAYGSVSHDKATLYCNDAKVTTKEVQEHLQEAGVTIAPYDDIVSDIQQHCDTSSSSTDDTPRTTKPKVWIDASRSNYALARVIPAKYLLDKQNAITPMKACKNDAELEGMRRAHIVDGVAMAHSISWLEDQVVTQQKKISEVEIDLLVTGERAKQPGFLEVSFPTIAGVGPNGAIIHYRAEENEIMRYLDTSNPILIDSGGQYEYGTTDVTRTWHFGEATEEFKEAYTRVLKGHIGLDTMTWPENTPGFVLDVFARKSLWEAGMDYGHGTGHGVGAALNVHEGPMGISPRFKNTEVLKEGMVISNEPGYYVDGGFGIRIENLMEIIQVDVANKNTKKKFYQFKKLTMIPIQTNLIHRDLITDTELDWVDEYHNTVWETVGPLLEEGSPGKEWLKKSCAKIER